MRGFFLNPDILVTSSNKGYKHCHNRREMLLFKLFCRIIFALSLIIHQASSAQSNDGLNTGSGACRPNDCSYVENGIDMCDYLTNEEMETKIRQLRQKYPKLVQIDTIGKSALGVNLTYLKITSNKASERLKPKFK